MTDEPGEAPLLGALSSGDHYTLEASDWVGGATDRGLRKDVNQDAVRVAARDRTQPWPTAALVVSDGVSTSLGSGAAAEVAATTACALLVDFFAAHPDPDLPEIEAALEESFALALERVLDVEADAPSGSCTLIAGVVGPHGLTVANVGDCRSYWVGDDGEAQCLSVDDSVAQARILMGIPREEAERGFQAHAITNWLGPDTPSGRPSLQSFLPPGPGWLVVCSDGLWNYASEPEVFGALVREECETSRSPVELATRLVEWANAAGGHDNISVALARIFPR
ncbi:MAG TPA: PP2C family serine/threonine-protein phosphatase [Propionibacteriaceae bacterium]|nr:PP2C family serine/threonine-protein phosphatase [Propionibacteriaceae bacterium]